MDVTRIISEIDSQIAKLQQARTLLLGETAPKPGRGRPKKIAAAVAAVAPVAPKAPNGRKKRNLSTEARKRIADAQKKRWAERRKQA